MPLLRVGSEWHDDHVPEVRLHSLWLLAVSRLALCLHVHGSDMLCLLASQFSKHRSKHRAPNACEAQALDISLLWLHAKAQEDQPSPPGV